MTSQQSSWSAGSGNTEITVPGDLLMKDPTFHVPRTAELS